MITFKDFFSFKHNRFFWLNLLGIIVFIALAIQATLWGLDVYTRHGEAHIVPNVKNQPLEQAQNALLKSRIVGVVIDSSYVKGMPSGIVLDQTPAGGMRVKEGRTVYLTINTNEIPQIKIPDIIDNSSMRQAAAKLKAMGFKLTEPEMVAGEQDWVYGIKYRGRELKSGDKVPHEALLTLCIGSIQMRDSLSLDSLNMQLDNLDTDSEPAQVDDSWF